MRKFRYPVDTDQFQKIREQGLLYVDKTDMMFDLADRYPLQLPERRVYKCGVSISSEHRNITHWRITDAEGKLIEDKYFIEKK